MGQEYRYAFDELQTAPLHIDAVYEGGSANNVSDDPISRLLPGTGNQGGFRAARCTRDRSRIAYVVIYTSKGEVEWPDYLDSETGLFRYYGDNRRPGANIHGTKRKGNQLLRAVYGDLNSGNQQAVPPFFIFERAGRGRDVRFRGLAAPGNPGLPPDRDLVAFWRTMDGQRFQNYEAYFTVLDTKSETISREWLTDLRLGACDVTRNAPSCWKEFIEKGRSGIHPLRAETIRKYPGKEAQLPSDRQGRDIVAAIRKRYGDDPYKFEPCACRIAEMMDPHFVSFDVTRPWRDGGRDALGKYRIGIPGHTLDLDYALEAKCYGEDNGVGVRAMSRLISRIKYREFGILVTTGFVSKQAWEEVNEDGHPIVMVTGADIAQLMIEHSVTANTVEEWLNSV